MSAEPGWLRWRISEGQAALARLTVLPVGQRRAVAPGAEGWAWPLAGLALGGLMAWGWTGALWLGMRPLVAAMLALALGLVAGGFRQERALGLLAGRLAGGAGDAAYGAMALFVTLGLRWALMAQLGRVQSFIALAVAARAVVVPVMAAMPVAAGAMPLAPGAMPLAAGAMPSRVTGGRMGVALGLGLGALLLGFAWPTALAVASAMVIAAAGLSLVVMRRLGGQSDEVLGAVQVLAEVAGWLVLARAGTL